MTTFIDLLENPATKQIIESLEWGSSDQDLVKHWKGELLRLANYDYDNACFVKINNPKVKRGQLVRAIYTHANGEKHTICGVKSLEAARNLASHVTRSTGWSLFTFHYDVKIEFQIF